MARMNRQFGALVLAVGLSASMAWAQQKDPRASAPDKPVPPIGDSSSKTPPATGDASGAVPAGMVPDNRPVTGAEQFTLGSGGGQRSYVLARVHFREIADSNSTSTPGSATNFDSASLLNGELTLKRLWSRSEFSLGYAGGGAIYNTRSDLNQSFHEVSLSQRMAWRRWTLLLTDEASYLPESSFGYAGYNPLSGLGLGLGGFGTTFSNLNPLFRPNQSILTGLARRVSNTAVGEVQYNFSPRSAFTASGSYGILRFLDTGFVDNSDVIVRAGYNYALNNRDTLGVVYGFSEISFSGTSERILDHLVHVAYGRRITGRLALQLSGGPQINTFRNVPTSTTTSTTTPDTGTQTSWSMGASLRYQMPRTGFSLSYLHGITGGSGLLFGAQTDEVDVAADRQLSRMWSGTVGFGYAHNKALQQTAMGSNPLTFQSWNASAGLGRTLGRRMKVVFTYNMQRQATDTGVCITGTCSSVFLRHQLGIGLDWTSRQYTID